MDRIHQTYTLNIISHEYSLSKDNIPQKYTLSRDNISQSVLLAETIFLMSIPLTGTVFLKSVGHEINAYSLWGHENVRHLQGIHR